MFIRHFLPWGRGWGGKTVCSHPLFPWKEGPGLILIQIPTHGNSHLVNADPGLHSQHCFLELKNKLGPAGARAALHPTLVHYVWFFFKLSFTLKTNLGVSLFLCTIGIYRCYLCCLTFIKFWDFEKKNKAISCLVLINFTGTMHSALICSSPDTAPANLQDSRGSTSMPFTHCYILSSLSNFSNIIYGLFVGCIKK